MMWCPLSTMFGPNCPRMWIVCTHQREGNGEQEEIFAGFATGISSVLNRNQNTSVSGPLLQLRCQADAFSQVWDCHAIIIYTAERNFRCEMMLDDICVECGQWSSIVFGQLTVLIVAWNAIWRGGGVKEKFSWTSKWHKILKKFCFAGEDQIKTQDRSKKIQQKKKGSGVLVWHRRGLHLYLFLFLRSSHLTMGRLYHESTQKSCRVARTSHTMVQNVWGARKKIFGQNCKNECCSKLPRLPRNLRRTRQRDQHGRMSCVSREHVRPKIRQYRNMWVFFILICFGQHLQHNK